MGGVSGDGEWNRNKCSGGQNRVSKARPVCPACLYCEFLLMTPAELRLTSFFLLVFLSFPLHPLPPLPSPPLSLPLYFFIPSIFLLPSLFFSSSTFPHFLPSLLSLLHSSLPSTPLSPPLLSLLYIPTDAYPGTTGNPKGVMLSHDNVRFNNVQKKSF